MFFCLYVPDVDIVINRGESFRESLEHSMNPELQKVTVLYCCRSKTISEIAVSLTY